MKEKIYVTRGGQVTIKKEIREALGIKEGTPVYERRMGNMIVITKADPEFWDRYEGESLPENFDEIFKKIRERGNVRKRLKKLGIIK